MCLYLCVCICACVHSVYVSMCMCTIQCTCVRGEVINAMLHELSCPTQMRVRLPVEDGLAPQTLTVPKPRCLPQVLVF